MATRRATYTIKRSDLDFLRDLDDRLDRANDADVKDIYDAGRSKAYNLAADINDAVGADSVSEPRRSPKNASETRAEIRDLLTDINTLMRNNIVLEEGARPRAGSRGEERGGRGGDDKGKERERARSASPTRPRRSPSPAPVVGPDQAVTLDYDKMTSGDMVRLKALSKAILEETELPAGIQSIALIGQLKRVMENYSAASVPSDIFSVCAQACRNYGDDAWADWFDDFLKEIENKDINPSDISSILRDTFQHLDALIRAAQSDGGGIAQSSETFPLKPSAKKDSVKSVVPLVSFNYGTLPSRRKGIQTDPAIIKEQQYNYLVYFNHTKRALRQYLKALVQYHRDLVIVRSDMVKNGLSKTQGIRADVRGINNDPVNLYEVVVSRRDYMAHEERFEKLVKNIAIIVEQMGRRKKDIIPYRDAEAKKEEIRRAHKGRSVGDRFISVADPIFMTWLENEDFNTGNGDIFEFVRRNNPNRGGNGEILRYLKSLSTTGGRNDDTALGLGFFNGISMFRELFGLTDATLIQGRRAEYDKNDKVIEGKEGTLTRYTATPALAKLLTSAPQFTKYIGNDDRIAYDENTKGLTILQISKDFRDDKAIISKKKAPRKLRQVERPDFSTNFITLQDISAIAPLSSVPKAQITSDELFTLMGSDKNDNSEIPGFGTLTYGQVRDFVHGEFEAVRDRRKVVKPSKAERERAERERGGR